MVGVSVYFFKALSSNNWMQLNMFCIGNRQLKGDTKVERTMEEVKGSVGKAGIWNSFVLVWLISGENLARSSELLC
jgi:hypothetical protein